MKQSEYIKYCQNELQRSRRWRDSSNYDENWRRFVDLYRGKQYDTDTGDDQLIVNLVFATKNVLGPAVAINNPKFVVNARKPDSQAQAVLTTEILNYLWRTHRYQAEFRLAVDDFIIMGHGWVKTGYKFVKPPESKKTDAESGNALLNQESYAEGVDDREDVDGNVESELTIHDDRPFVERISPFDVFVDPDARHPKEMRWIAQRTWRPVADVHVDERYSATNRKKVGGRSWSRYEDTDARDSNSNTGGPNYAEIIEFYDIKRNKVCTFALDAPGDDGVEGANGFLIKPKEIPFALGHPFTMIRNYEVPDHYYPIGDVEEIESLQMELNETRTQMMNHRKRFARKWLYNRDAFDKEGVNALESDIDNAMIPVISDGDPGSVIAPVPAVITPPEFYDQSSMISTDMDRVSGVSDYQRGAQQAIKRTATEAAMIQDAANSRAQDRLAKIEDVLASVAEKVIGLMQQYLTGQHVARIVTVPGASWLEYDKDYIQGQFDYHVVGGSTEPQNETFKRQSAMQLVDASMPFLEMGIPDPVMLYRKILDSFGITDTTEFISEQAGQPGGAPAQQGAPPEQGPPQGGPPQGPPPPEALPPGPPPPEAGIGNPIPEGIPPEVLDVLPPEIMEGIMNGSIPPEMIQQILMELEGAAPAPGGGMPPMPPMA